MKRIAMILVALAVLATAVRADVISANAGSGGVTKGTFVKLSAAGTIVTATAVSDSVVGVCEQTADADALTKYALPGTRTTITSGEAIAVGDLLTAGAGGKAFVLDESDTSDQRYAALALTATVSGADEDVQVIVVVGSEQSYYPFNIAAVAGTKTLAGTPTRIVFSPTTGETLTWTAPAGYDLVVLNAYGWKTAAAGVGAEDQWALQNNDGSAANIFDTEELAGVTDGLFCQFDTLDDAENEVESGDTLDLVAGETSDDDGADGIIVVEGLLKTAD